LTNDHDFLTYAKEKAALSGVYDQKENKGFVSIGMFLKTGKSISSGDTPNRTPPGKSAGNGRDPR
jgi:hypothetical protein